MKLNLRRLDGNTKVILEAIGDMADQDRMPAYVVGGFVRDLLLKRDTNDIDIVVEGNAIKFAKKFLGFLVHVLKLMLLFRQQPYILTKALI